MTEIYSTQIWFSMAFCTVGGQPDQVPGVAELIPHSDGIISQRTALDRFHYTLLGSRGILITE